VSPLLDPVWPWDRLWAVLSAMPATDRALALLAAVAALVLPMRLLVRPEVQRPLPVALALLLAWGAVLLARFGSLGELPLLVPLLYGPPALAGLSLGSYLGAPRGATTKISPRRVFVVLALRAVAFLLVLVAIARPAFAWEQRSDSRATVWVAVDFSRSMTIVDEDGNLSRWKRVQAALADARPLLDRLGDEAGVDFKFFRFDAVVADLDPVKPGEPDGGRTEFAGMLRSLQEMQDPARRPRMLLVISDGADNGAAPALAEAARWREMPCPVHAFSVGRSNTSQRQSDVALTSITTTPQPFVPVRGKLTVKVTIDAHGYENKPATLKLFIEAPDEKGVIAEREAIPPRRIRMPLRTGNEEEMVVDAPAVPCEAKIRVSVTTEEPDSLPLNNVIETFVTVSKEGTSVLLVDRRRFEAMDIHSALVGDPRIRVTSINVSGPGGTLALDGQPYDAIILGDVSVDEVRAVDKAAVEKIEKMVGGGTGLMMLGGYRNHAAGGWGKTALAAVLPIDLKEDDQVEEKVRMEPTEDGLRGARYLFDLDGGADPLAAWRGLATLSGHTVLKKAERVNTSTLATAGSKPVLVRGEYSSGKGAKPARVLAFGGDTTNQWRRTEKGLTLFERFWRRVAVWLARQEDAEGGPWVRPDARRIPVRADLGFQCGVRAKGGGEVPGAKIEAEVVTPAGVKIKVPLSRGKDETRGLFQATQAPGVYRVAVRSEGVEATSRVIVFDEDVEMTRPAADPAFLAKLASAGGGDAMKIDGLNAFLARLAEQPVSAVESRRVTRPEWRTEEPSGFLAAFLAVFCLVLCLEWALRRMWGMV